MNFPAANLPAENIDCMSDVLRPCAPFQIMETVIEAVSVLMIYMWFFCLTNKRQQHKAMNIKVKPFTIADEIYLQVLSSPTYQVLADYSIRYCSEHKAPTADLPCLGSNAPHVADFVIRKIRNRQPSFAGKFGFGQDNGRNHGLPPSKAVRVRASSGLAPCSGSLFLRNTPSSTRTS